MMTTAGSLALAGTTAPRDASIVGRLRDAGAVIIGKTNLSEWANFRSTHSVSGWSGRGGQCRNPYAIDRNPFGSSSGAGGVNAALEVLKAQGATLVDPVEIPHLKDYGDQEFTVLLYEFKADLNSYLSGLGAGNTMKTLADLIAFNDAHKDTEMPYFGQEIFTQAQEKGP